jgi:chemotaxis protein histidine kinase CheA
MGDPQRDLELVRMKFKQSAAELDEQKRAYINLSNTATESQQASAKKIGEAEQKARGWYRKALKEEEDKKAAQKAHRIALEQLKNRTQQANLSEEEKKALEAERKKLEAQAANLQGDINTLEINLNAAKTNATEAQARAERELNAANTRATNERNRADKGIGAANTRADKERNRAEAAATRANNANTRANDANIAMAKATAIANEAQKQTEAATTRAHTAEQKVETVTAELVETQGNLKVAETTAKVAKEFVDKLGGDVHELEHSVKTIVNNTPINANILFQQFRSRGVKVWLKSGRTTTRTDTILIEQGNYVYALLHTSDTPFPIGPKAMGISRVEPTLSTPEAGKPKPMAYNLPFAQFLKDDPRVLASPLMSVSQAASRGIRPYQIAAEPYKFPKAFVISRDGKSYGEVEFKFNPAHKGYVKMDKPFAGGIFSRSFNPSKGDLVLSQKGELLGMMANNTYCYVIRDLKSESSIAFRKDLNRATIAKTLKTHHATIQRKAFALR